MMHLLRPRFAFAILLLFAVGCGNSAPSEPPPDPNQLSKDQFKERLEFIAKEGSTGSALAGIVEGAEKTGNPVLVADAKKLQGTNNPAQAKKLATEMLGKLK